MKSFLRKTAISWVKSDRILLRGYPIDELAGNVSWAGAVYLALVGELPEPKVARQFEAILVSVVDHGPLQHPLLRRAPWRAPDRRSPVPLPPAFWQSRSPTAEPLKIA